MNEIVVINLGANDLQKMLDRAAQTAHQNNHAAPEQPIRGIHNLAKFLNISAPRAQKLKNDGLIPYFQSGRLVLFDPAKVRAVWQLHNVTNK